MLKNSFVEQLQEGEEILAKFTPHERDTLSLYRHEFYATNRRVIQTKRKIRGREELSELSYNEITSVIQKFYHHKFFIGVGVSLAFLGLFGPILGLQPVFGSNAFLVSLTEGLVIAGAGMSILRVASYELRTNSINKNSGRWKFEIVGYPIQKSDKESAETFMSVIQSHIGSSGHSSVL